MEIKKNMSKIENRHFDTECTGALVAKMYVGSVSRSTEDYNTLLCLNLKSGAIDVEKFRKRINKMVGSYLDELLYHLWTRIHHNARIICSSR